MKVNGPSYFPIQSNQSKKTEKKQKSGSKKTQLESELKVSTSISVEDDSQHLIAQYVEKIAARKFGKYSDSNLLATAIQIVSGKLKHNEDAVKEIKKAARKRK